MLDESGHANRGFTYDLAPSGSGGFGKKINPAYGGLEVLKEIKTFDNKIPVILNSAYATFKSDFSTWLADAYVIKSSDLSELKQQIKELLHLN